MSVDIKMKEKKSILEAAIRQLQTSNLKLTELIHKEKNQDKIMKYSQLQQRNQSMILDYQFRLKNAV